MTAFDAVLFDWCGTLVQYPTKIERVAGVFERLGRDVEGLAATVDAILAAQRLDHVVEAHANCDESAAAHRDARMLLFAEAGLDEELADARELSYADFSTYTPHPETPRVCAQLAAAGVGQAVVSDFHVDLRPQLASMGVLEAMSTVVLSCELGVTKPDVRMFEAAVEALAVEPQRCLMVGDNPHPDCGAAALGMTTRILPVRRPRESDLLDRVLSLVGA